MFEVGRDIAQEIRQRPRDYRIALAASMLTFLFILFSARLVQLGLEAPNSFRRGAGQSEWVIPRADITDRNGELLAGTAADFNIKIYPSKIKDKSVASAAIKKINPALSDTGISSVVNSNKAAVYINNRPLGMGDDMLASAEKVRADWLEVEEIKSRKFAKRRAAAHVVGFVGKDGTGLEGAEKFYDKRLKESPEPLALSVDFRIQAIMHRELEIAMNKFQTKFAVGILMDSLTGEILAAAQLPDFDPENVAASPESARTFIPARGVYEIGSVMKIINTATALVSGVPADTKYEIGKSFKIGKHQIRDKGSRKVHDFMTLEDIMVNSSNIGSARVALSLPVGVQVEMFSRLNLDKPIDVEGIGRTAAYPMRNNPKEIELANMAFGHGISVSMMNLVAAINAVSNGGIYVMPRLTRLADGEQISGRRVVSAEISEKIRGMMRRVSEETTGRLARISGINIGAKTATAEKIIDGRYSGTKNLNSFVAVFPIESPRYILFVSLDEPESVDGLGRTAALNAAPVAGGILSAVVPMLLK